ncbi:hypothetical protein JZ751_025968 [Albula glossodonta]|uniref:Uncharacterized protein n=1 Tax=Albula glossodonta TaxID=121402 RepID=A0A8T2NPI7_9TELE|nr:hypothetical protein JZ751_025968 [Albula glossodonta]
MTLSLSPAAVCQCFTLVSLCTSAADPNWIQVRNVSDPNSKQLIYGVAFVLHAAQNVTDTGPIGGVNGWGMWLLYALAAVCYSSILFSSCSFLLDFLGSGKNYPRLITTLHICTALAICGTCYWVILHNLRKGLVGWFWDMRGAKGLQPSPGESFYIAILALLFSGMAATFSFSRMREHSPLGEYAPIEPGDSDSEPPSAREPGEEWGEVFPD